MTGEKQHHIIGLSNDFYTTIPHDFGLKKPPLIDHLLRVKEKNRMVEHLQLLATVQ